MSDFRTKRNKIVPAKLRVSVVKRTPLLGHEKRRGVRMNSQVRVSVEWDSGGERKHGEAETRIVGPYGCLMVLAQNLDVNQHLQVTNLLSRQSNAGVVVWRGNERAEGWELGVELINPAMNFWGVEL